jgi:hypothetical protein
MALSCTTSSNSMRCARPRSARRAALGGLVLGVAAQQLGAAAAQDAVAVQAEALAVGLVDEAVAQVAVDVGHAHGQVVGDLAHEALALGQLQFEHLARADVLQRAHQAQRLAVGPALALAHASHPAPAAAVVVHLQFQVPGTAMLDGGTDGGTKGRPRFGDQGREGLVQRGHVVLGHAMHAAGLCRPAQGLRAQVHLPAADAGDAFATRQPAVAVAAGGLHTLAFVAPLGQQQPRQLRQVAQRGQQFGPGVAGLGVQRAQQAHTFAARGRDRQRGHEADAPGRCHLRVRGQPGVARGVGHQQRLVGAHRQQQRRQVVQRRLQVRQAEAGLGTQALPVHQPQHGQAGAAGRGHHAHQVVQGGIVGGFVRHRRVHVQYGGGPWLHRAPPEDTGQGPAVYGQPWLRALRVGLMSGSCRC